MACSAAGGYPPAAEQAISPGINLNSCAATIMSPKALSPKTQMANSPPIETFDAVVIGSGFGGSVSAMRLTEKGYRVLVLERGKRYRDEDFARSTWNVWKYLWLPAARNPR